MLRLFLPQICVHCGAHCDDSDAQRIPLAKYLCLTCLRQFSLFQAPRQEDLIPKSQLFRELPYDVSIHSPFAFQAGGIIQSLIHHFKYAEMPRLAGILGSECVERIGPIRGHYDLLVPVPLHRTRYSERGYNQSEMLAHGIAARTEIPVAKRKHLRRIRQTPSQTGMTLGEREENVRGAFGLSRYAVDVFYGKRILILDDVMTTGATLASAAITLAAAKPKKIDLLAFAAVTETIS